MLPLKRFEIAMFTLEIHYIGTDFFEVGPYITQYDPRMGFACIYGFHVGKVKDMDKIRYRFIHPMSGTGSPVYEHEFTDTVIKPCSNGSMISGVKEFSASQVWPELADHIDINQINLPQFVS